MTYNHRSSSKQDTSTQQITTNRRKSSLEILNNAVSSWTEHNDVGSQAEFPRCHPNTRVVVLKKIMDWIRRYDSEGIDRPIMWLYGPVGAGKSTIVHSIIELCLEYEIITATFFFDRTDGTRNHAGSLIAALVYQIYHSVPAAQSHILAAIDTDPFIFRRSLKHQFAQLITKPFRSVISSSSSWIPGSYCVIVIDGLDECIFKEQLQVLSIISDAIRQIKLPVLFLIASRPEPQISSAFASNEMDDVYMPLVLDETYNPDDDIRLFLQDNFRKIKSAHPLTSTIPLHWPTAETVEALVLKSSGRFFYPAAVIKYVQSAFHQPVYRLKIVLDLRPTWNSNDLPFTLFDDFYTMIISSAEDIQRVLYAVSLYTHQVFQDSHHDVREFMSLDEGHLETLFFDLGSLVSVETNPYPKRSKSRLRFLHASLHDFLMDPTRSKEFYMGIEACRTQHLVNILQYIALALYDDDYVHAENRFKSIVGFFRRESPLCRDSSPELFERAISFPLAEIFHKAVHNRSPFVPFFLFFDLFPFFRQMALFDKKWISVEKRHRDGLNVLFFPMESTQNSPEGTSNEAGT